MAATVAAAIAGTAAAAAYLDAKYHIRADLTKGDLNNAAVAAQKFMAERAAENRITVYHDLQAWAEKDLPNHTFLEYQDRTWTYKQFFQDLQRVGNWLMNDLGIERGEMVALNGPNTAEYLLIWFALDGIGACQSFINHNLTGNALAHSIKLCEPRYVLADHDTTERLEPCRKELEESSIKIVYYDDRSWLSTFKDTTPIPRSRTDGIDPASTKCLVYTSGTTGLPKGVMLVAGRMLNTARSMAEYLKLTPRDKFYTCLPLYHSAAQSLCTTPVIFAGASLRLGKKFSHATFWPEVSASGANHLQYVGELCRYLTNAPPHPLERSHRVQVAWGNGMRPDVWEQFRQRFHIPVIHELYAATDGLGATFNRNRGDFTRSAIGLRGALWHLRTGAREVHARIDPDTEDLVKDAAGWVERSGAGEPGEVLHAVDPALAAAAFRGYYSNEAATQKRFLRDVFAPGDLWFRSGDVHRTDRDGRVFFVDRLGDTFRWKSENVSSTEVADVLAAFPQVAEANVYGVAVPHADGRAGCATLVLRAGVPPADLDCPALAAYVRAELPRYAVPLFLRVAPQLSYTGTFKIQKGQAKREGVDLDLIRKSGSEDAVFWLPPGEAAYRPYAPEDWEALRSGRIKL